MPTDIELAELEKVASVIYIIGAIIAIISANKTQQMKIQGQTTFSVPTPAQLSVIIGLIYLIGNVIYELIAYVRLKKVEEDIKTGTEKGSIMPNVYINIGWILGIAGSIFRIIGAKLRVEQQHLISIL